MMVTRPQTLGYGISDSPAGLAAFFYDKFNDWTYSGGDAEKALTRDEMLDHTARSTDLPTLQLPPRSSTGRITTTTSTLWSRRQRTSRSPLPCRCFRARSIVRQRAGPSVPITKLFYFNEVDKGGHFAAWEQPELFASELRAAFKSLH
jgi:pimeloyl-ACP methyl ester carboxylesterase